METICFGLKENRWADWTFQYVFQRRSKDQDAQHARERECEAEVGDLQRVCGEQHDGGRRDGRDRVRAALEQRCRIHQARHEAGSLRARPPARERRVGDECGNEHECGGAKRHA